MDALRIAVVTTFRFVPAEDAKTIGRCWSVLSSFLCFHLSKGVDHVFLFADADDNSNDVYLERVVSEFAASQVSINVRNEQQAEKQRQTCKSWPVLGGLRSSEVPARQSLNAEDALYRAAAKGIHWLIHIDIDELFYTSEASIKPHFHLLEAQGVEHMTYANHEAVPCREDIGDYFTEVTLFRMNHLQLPVKPEVRHCTLFWRQRRRHGQYMLAYDNGKSAVRVLPDRIVPHSVHKWRCFESTEKGDTCPGDGYNDLPSRQVESQPASKMRNEAEDGEARGCLGDKNRLKRRDKPGVRSAENKSRGPPKIKKLVRRSALADARDLNFDEVLECTDPCILHYPSCGLDWLRDKYQLLGDFPSSWFGGNLAIAPCFHLDARDACGYRRDVGDEGDEDSGQEAGVRTLYHREVMICPDELSKVVAEQLQHGVLKIISSAADSILQTRSMEVKAKYRAGTDDQAHCAAENTRIGMACKVSNPGQAAALRESSMVSLDKYVPRGEQSQGAEAAGGRAGIDSQTGLGSQVDFDSSWILAAVVRDYL